ncbi:MAG: PIN domain-containing protein [Bacillota bacterium]
MDRLFLDANILFSAAYGSRGLDNFWVEARKGKIRLLASAYVVEEATRNLSTQEQITRLKELSNEIVVVSEASPGIHCPVDIHEKDRPVLMAAVQSRATHLITGDLRHFGPYRKKKVEGVIICTAGDYLTGL